MMMYRLCKWFDFSAAHQLQHLGPDHPCARLHGHNYRVELIIESPILDDRGFCQVDYRELDAFKDWVDQTIDHRNLNDVMPVRTTAENLARWLFDEAKRITPYLTTVRVYETPKTWAEYCG
jgi:6-pyruvoyltetrahydropterin/6-carboxytetrahydropterin synthase